jgi:hypothetical protein
MAIGRAPWRELGWHESTLTRQAAGSWANLTADARSAILKDYHSLGKTLRVSAFGQNDNVTTNANDPEEVAASLSQFAADYNLDGVDINYEGGRNVGCATADDRFRGRGQRCRFRLAVHVPRQAAF